MGARYILIALLILAACEPALQTIPTSEYKSLEATTETVDLCKDVNCTGGQVCQAGNCGCPTGKKLCNNDCISSTECCTDDDCDSGNCQDGVCLEAKECKFGEELKKGECRCAEDKFYCGEQGKCIDRTDCCIHSQCKSFERCVPTNWRTSLCIQIEEKKQCKLLSDLNRTELYEIKDNEFRIGATDWWNDGSITFNFSNESIRLRPNELKSYETANATLFHEGIEVIGGFCKEDEDD